MIEIHSQQDSKPILPPSLWDLKPRRPALDRPFLGDAMTSVWKNPPTILINGKPSRSRVSDMEPVLRNALFQIKYVVKGAAEGKLEAGAWQHAAVGRPVPAASLLFRVYPRV